MNLFTGTFEKTICKILSRQIKPKRKGFFFGGRFRTEYASQHLSRVGQKHDQLIRLHRRLEFPTEIHL